MATNSGSGPSAESSSPPLELSSSTSAPSRSTKPLTSTTRKSSATDTVLRNTLRYTISAQEYALLHKYVLSRSRVVRQRVPNVATVEKIIDGTSSSRARRSSSLSGNDADDKSKGKGKGKGATAKINGRDDYNARAVRHALRVFVATLLGVKAYEAVTGRLMKNKRSNGDLKATANAAAKAAQKQPFYKNNALRLSLSLSTILLLYRLIFRFLTRLRVHLLDSSAAPFRARNPRTAATLTSTYAPAVGAGFAGLALGIYPSQQLRASIAIYAMFRALEFGWNLAEDEGMVWGWREKLVAGGKGKVTVKRERPWWWGSWMLQPFAFGQLLHAIVFDRDCFPAQYGDFIFKNTTAYLHPRPSNLPSSIQWPSAWEVAESLSRMAKLHWPAYISPTLFPDQETLPASLKAVAPLTSPAHPLISSLSCATLHPSDPSCLRTYLTFWLRSFPRLGRFFLIIYSVLLLPKYKSLYHAPVTTLNRLLARVLRLSTFITGSISTAWASICLFQHYLPRSMLPTQRFFLGGFLSGLWGFIERKNGRGVFLYSARTSVDSLWKVGVKRRWWRGVKGGDVWVFVASLMLMGVVYERDARAIQESSWRKGVGWVRGEGWNDWSVEEEDDGEAGEKEE